MSTHREKRQYWALVFKTQGVLGRFAQERHAQEFAELLTGMTWEHLKDHGYETRHTEGYLMWLLKD